ncbi:hypothetical protein [Streptomyces sp. NPDC049949]|uniref:hypothetical protein n=1 Tax=Streptomyces sp. NPDC049949 TaxID=3154627 RepID=UPI003430AFAC
MVINQFRNVMTSAKAGPVVPTPTDLALLDRLMNVGDPDSDTVVDDLFAHGQVERVNELLHDWKVNGQPLPDGLPDKVVSFLTAGLAVPAWADQAAISRAQRFEQEHVACAAWVVRSALCSPVPRRKRRASARGRRARLMSRAQRAAQLSVRRHAGIESRMGADAAGGMLAAMDRLHGPVRPIVGPAGWGYARRSSVLLRVWGDAVCLRTRVSHISRSPRGVPCSRGITQWWCQVWRASGGSLSR